MDPRIENFINYLTSAVETTIEQQPNYTNLPKGSYDDALALTSAQAQQARVNAILINFEEQIASLYTCLRQDSTTADEVSFLLKNLGNFLKKLSEPEFQECEFSERIYVDDGDSYKSYRGDYDVYATYTVKYPVGDNQVNFEINALINAVLNKLEQFNNSQLPPVEKKLPEVCGKLKTIPAREEQVATAPLEPTIFDLLIKLTLTTADELEPYYYSGLSEFKALSSFMNAMKRNARNFMLIAKDPNDLRNTTAYRLAATPRSQYSLHRFFSTSSQKTLDQIITLEIKRRKYQQPPVAVAEAKVYGGL